MTRYRHHLPQLADRLFVTDGGLETTLVFHDGIDLPAFAAFTQLDAIAGRERLRRYFERYIDIGLRHGAGIILESATWRANADWGTRLGYDADALDRVNRLAIELLLELRGERETPTSPLVISGNIGPRGDGYRAEQRMTVSEAEHYHRPQIRTFADTGADMVAAFTMTHVEEASGITLAAREAGMPVAISFTLETDGRLPSGEDLPSAIRRVDAISDGYPAYYLINCAHPTHFIDALGDGNDWRLRVRGLRANASRKSHAELDESTVLDIGNPLELGAQYRALRRQLPALTIVGGCCGTDHRHVESVCSAMAA
jgi:S-methylmethionine-dependent homocysteine/selenocysteine methylase